MILNLTITPWFERKFQFGNSPEMLPLFLERMEGTLIRLSSKVKGVSEADLSWSLISKWSIKQNIGHLAEVEEISLIRVREILSGISPMTSAIQPPKADYNAMNIDDVFALFKSVREKNIRQYDDISREELAKVSVHPRLNQPMNPVDLAYFHAEHDDHHLVAINRILQNL